MGQAQVTFTVNPSTLTFEPTADTFVDAGSPDHELRHGNPSCRSIPRP